MGLQTTKQGPAKITMVPQVFQKGLPGFIPLEIVMFRCRMVFFIPSQKWINLQPSISIHKLSAHFVGLPQSTLQGFHHSETPRNSVVKPCPILHPIIPLSPGKPRKNLQHVAGQIPIGNLVKPKTPTCSQKMLG